uniref:Uncharacterized protein n=1 Tax=Caulerpa manorensis TaxID=717648 RepID=A0A2P0QIC2_9CHLO|nr:hypothetical protein [Caulerpa manorensis]ARO74514.1 hypothetical protein [Caulerpa manorensis]
MNKKFINYLAEFLLLNYQYKSGSRVRLRWVYLNFINVLEKESFYSNTYPYKQFRHDLEELAGLFGIKSNFIEHRVQNTLYVLHLQERLDNSIIPLVKEKGNLKYVN